MHDVKATSFDTAWKARGAAQIKATTTLGTKFTQSNLPDNAHNITLGELVKIAEPCCADGAMPPLRQKGLAF